MLVKIVHQVDKSLLRILMTAFYRAAPHAQDLYDRAVGRVSPENVHYQNKRKELWGKAAELGPPYPPHVDKQVRSYFRINKPEKSAAAKANFLTELKSFIQQLKLSKPSVESDANYCCKQFRLSVAADVPGFNTLQKELDKNFVQMLHSIDLEKLQDAIFSGGFRPDVLNAIFAPAAQVKAPAKEAAPPAEKAPVSAKDVAVPPPVEPPAPDAPAALVILQGTEADQAPLGYRPH